jgi:hypothetical protein
MPLLGQASGGFTESSSALRLLHVGVRNTVGVLTDDSFTQTNPPNVATNVSAQVDQGRFGVLSGSVAFARADAGSNHVGGPSDQSWALGGGDPHPEWVIGYRALGVFINTATGNAYENLPGQASGKGPYVSAQGTYGNQLFERALIGDSAAGGTVGNAVTYITGMELIASRNGYLTPREVITAGAIDNCDVAAIAAMSFVWNAANSSTTIGVVKMPPDAVMNEVVYDQRI